MLFMSVVIPRNMLCHSMYDSKNDYKSSLYILFKTIKMHIILMCYVKWQDVFWLWNLLLLNMQKKVTNSLNFFIQYYVKMEKEVV